MSAISKKGVREQFAQFFENPARETFRELVRNQLGEFDDLDYKRELQEPENLAKDILGMANKQGGVIVFGIEQKNDHNLEPVGLVLTDKTEFEIGIRKYTSAELKFEVIDFIFQDAEYTKIRGKSFRVVVVEYDPRFIPFLPNKASSILKTTDIYTRDNASTHLANYSELQDILNRRVATKYSTASELSLQRHLSELHVLYSAIPRISIMTAMMDSDHPQIRLGKFIQELIYAKQQIIKSMITDQKHQGKEDDS